MPKRVLCLIPGILLGSSSACLAEVGAITPAGFTAHQTVTVSGTPDEAYDLFTGDVSGWWDHTLSGEPLRLVIEPKVGGGFDEIFDGSGDGVRHATITLAERGKRLRMQGPLGLGGHALLMVSNIGFEPVGGDSTRVTAEIRAIGEIADGWADAVDRVWRHFLVERFGPFVEGGGVPLD
jgi:hypothetical protein